MVSSMKKKVGRKSRSLKKVKRVKKSKSNEIRSRFNPTCNSNGHNLRDNKAGTLYCTRCNYTRDTTHW